MNRLHTIKRYVLEYGSELYCPAEVIQMVFDNFTNETELEVVASYNYIGNYLTESQVCELDKEVVEAVVEWVKKKDIEIHFLGDYTSEQIVKDLQIMLSECESDGNIIRVSWW